MASYGTLVLTIRLLDAFYHDVWGGVVFIFSIEVEGGSRLVGYRIAECRAEDAEDIADTFRYGWGKYGNGYHPPVMGLN
jgi:hypothetical protein